MQETGADPWITKIKTDMIEHSVNDQNTWMDRLEIMVAAAVVQAHSSRIQDHKNDTVVSRLDSMDVSKSRITNQHI